MPFLFSLLSQKIYTCKADAHPDTDTRQYANSDTNAGEHPDTYSNARQYSDTNAYASAGRESRGESWF